MDQYWFAMVSMTPTRPIQKRMRSPLHEMDDGNEDASELRETESNVSAPSAGAVAGIVRDELYNTIGPVDSKLTDMNASLDAGPKKMEHGMNLQDVRVTKLEHTVEAMKEASMEHRTAKFEEQIAQSGNTSTASRSRPRTRKFTMNENNE